MPSRLFYSILIGFLVIPVMLKGQEIRFSQYQSTPTYINPAQVGGVLNPEFRIHSRLQQFGVVSFRTGLASLALPIYLTSSKELSTGGIGLNVLQDVAGESGEFNTTIVQLSTAYNVYLNRYGTQWLSLGLQTGYRLIRVDYSNLQWSSQLRYNGFSSNNLPYVSAERQLNALSVNAGVFWSYDAERNVLADASPLQLYAGFSLQNINEPVYNYFSASEETLEMGYNALLGGKFWLNSQWTLAPDMLALWYGSWFTYQVGALVTYHTDYSTPTNPIPSALRLSVGTWYRENALVILVGMGGQKWEAALSYDANVASARRGINNQYALELSLCYQWLSRKAPKSQSTPLY